MACPKGFGPELSPSTLSFEVDEDKVHDPDDDAPLVLNPLQDISGSSAPPPIGSFTFIKDHYNILNGQIIHLPHPLTDLSGCFTEC